MKPILFFCGVLFPVLCLSGVNDIKGLDGTYYISGKTIIDAPKDESKNTHMFFQINGDAAMDLYKMIEKEAIYDPCLDDGSHTKFAGKMQCTESKDKEVYQCYFSIGVNTQDIGAGIVC